jgi:hypothetical protein
MPKAWEYGEKTQATAQELIDKYLSFAKPREEQVHETENYVSIPPALIITDEGNNVWTLGLMTAPKGKSPDGEFAFDVLRNGKWSGEVASRIERRKGRIRIFTCDGWKIWTGNSFF